MSGAGRIYAYTAPGYDVEWTRTVGSESFTGRGRIKVGWTGREDSKVRVKEQTGTVYPDGDSVELLLDEPAVREDGTSFIDTDVHHVLDAAGVQRTSEVVDATLDEVRAAIIAVRNGVPFDPERTNDFSPRPEQARAVQLTADYFTEHADDALPPRFLWNAKMRFGKTFTAYQLAKRMGWNRVLVLTYKPAVKDSWRDDLLSHVDFRGWRFADRDEPADPDDPSPLVWFASFQDLLGTTDEGEVKDHNVDLHLIEWDCVILDEYHFGAWQGAAKEVTDAEPKPPRYPERAAERAEEYEVEQAAEVVDRAKSGAPRLLASTPDSDIDSDLGTDDLRLTSAHYLYLSGTPFRALTEGEFNEDAIFNWTYPDEQHAKQQWAEQHPDRPNPYAELPKMEMFTYALSEMASVAIDQGEDGLFNLSGFFAAKKEGSEYHFEDPQRVAEFLNMLRGRLTQTATEKLLNDRKPPFPYADGRFTDAVRHSVWFMPSVASAHAMKAALESHPFFRDHLVHVAAGARAGMGADAKDPVDDMLAKAAQHGKDTITLSVGKLMTGVTIPQWGSILILRSLKSPESYFQAAFRVQSPWSTRNPDGSRDVKKETCYVFDFDPNRALRLIYDYGTKLAGSSATASPAETIEELIRFLPIFAFDGGRMDPIDVNAVMDWGTAGAGAAMLAKRWGSPRLIDLSDTVLNKLLADSGLLEQLEQMEDFRTLREDANKILAQSKKLKDTKRSAADGGLDEKEPDEAKEARKAKRKQVKSLRSKLLKFVQAVPVFMYLTDYREEALVDVIESLDTQLFERVTGLTLADFHRLSEIGVFHPRHMDEAIWQFRLFERASLDYLTPTKKSDRIGLWDHTEPAPPDSVVTEGANS